MKRTLMEMLEDSTKHFHQLLTMKRTLMEMLGGIFVLVIIRMVQKLLLDCISILFNLLMEKQKTMSVNLR